jgi:signal peptidase I
MKSASRHMLIAALSKFGSCEVTVGGESMKPFIRSGDVVAIVAVPPFPRAGEVAVFFDNGQLITHRVTRRKKNSDGSCSLTVYGDSSPGSGGTIAESQVIGVVRYLTRNHRKHALWLRSPLRLIAVPMGFLIRFLVDITK